MTTRGAAKRPATAGRIVVGARACDRQERHCRSRSESDEGRSPIGSRSFFGSPRRQIRSASARIGRDARFVSRGHRRPRAETITSLSVRVAMVHPSPDGDNSVTEHRGRHAAGARAHSYGTATGRRQVATLMRGVRCGIHHSESGSAFAGVRADDGEPVLSSLSTGNGLLHVHRMHMPAGTPSEI